MDGCDYCNTTFLVNDDTVNIPFQPLIDTLYTEVIIADKIMYAYCHCGAKSHVEIKYCPMCGKEL